MKNIKAIYCDFDGTITKTDTVNTFFEKYASPQWIEYEELWIAGKISSQENAIAQVALLPKLSKKNVNDFIEKIEIDESFFDFTDYLKKRNINFTIVSDGFDFFIEKTLKKYNINDIKYYANHLIQTDTGFSVEFPYHNSKCKIGAGMCKCEKVKEKKFAYVGDGTSDLCIAKRADTLFATKKLHDYCLKNSIKHNYFKSFFDIINVLEQ